MMEHCKDHVKMAEDVAVTRAIVEGLATALGDGNGSGLVGRFRKVEIKVAVMAVTLSAVVGAGMFLLVFSWNSFWEWAIG